MKLPIPFLSITIESYFSTLLRPLLMPLIIRRAYDNCSERYTRCKSSLP
jgi:hypothetical protein